VFPDSRVPLLWRILGPYTPLNTAREAFHLFTYSNTYNMVCHQLFKDERDVSLSLHFLHQPLVLLPVLCCYDCFTSSVYPSSTLMARKCCLTCHRANISLQLHQKHKNTVPDKNRDSKQSEKVQRKRMGITKSVVRNNCANDHLFCYSSLLF